MGSSSSTLSTFIISTKFADIFRLNSINIGLVPIETSQENVDALFAKIEATPSTNIKISIENKTVQCEEIAFSFELDDFSQKRILEGCLLYTSPSPRDQRGSRMPSSA